MKKTIALILLVITAGSRLFGQDAPPTGLPTVKTDSPQATVTTFLTAMNDYRQGIEADDDRLKERLADAVYCLNLTEFPAEQRDFYGEEAAIHLKEVIDRVALLEQMKFPSRGTARWQLQDSLITIIQVGGGERGGEYLFSGETVRRAKSLYEQVRHLPYLETSGQGALLNWKTKRDEAKGEVFIKKDNARYTMKTFMTAMEDYRKGVENGDAKLKARIDAAVSCLNLEEIPTVVRQEKGREIAILLKEAIDRIIVIDYEKIPIREKNGETVTRFRLKNSNERIVITRIDEGDHAGEFLFTKQTVAGARSFYDSLRRQPYLQGTGGGAHYKPDMIESIVPEFLKGTFILFPNWQWIGLFFAILIGYVVKVIVAHVVDLLKKVTARSKTDWDDKIIEAAEGPVGWVGAGVFWYFAILALRFEGTPLAILRVSTQVIISVAFIWTLYKLVDVFSDYLNVWAAKTDTVLDDHLVPLVKRALRTFIIIFGVLITVQNLGFNVMSLLAGLGLGGLALALAAQDTCANFFGSVMILTDRPFQVGDAVDIGGVTGTVEAIGFRSTRIRTFYDSQVTIPNSSLANTNIDNLGRRKFRRQMMTLGLTYDTPPEKMEAFTEGVKNIIKNNPITRKDGFHVAFESYGDFSLNVLLYYFLDTTDRSRELVERHHINLEILRFAAELGVEFAFPTQTLHMESFPEKQPTRTVGPFTAEEIKEAAQSFGPNGKNARPAGFGIFVPPCEDPDLKK